MPTSYRINRAIYIVNINHVFTKKNIFSSKSYASIMNKKVSFDIDDEFDFMLASFIFSEY